MPDIATKAHSIKKLKSSVNCMTYYTDMAGA